MQENEELAQEIWLSIFLQGSLEEVEQWTTELISFLEIKIQENSTFPFNEDEKINNLETKLHDLETLIQIQEVNIIILFYFISTLIYLNQKGHISKQKIKENDDFNR